MCNVPNGKSEKTADFPNLAFFGSLVFPASLTLEVEKSETLPKWSYSVLAYSRKNATWVEMDSFWTITEAREFLAHLEKQGAKVKLTVNRK